MGPFHRRASSLTEVQILVSVAKRGQNATFCIYSRCGTDQHGGVIQPWGTVSIRGVFGPRKRGLRFATDDDEGITADDEGIAADDEGITADDEGITADDGGIAADDDGINADEEGITADDG
ncbi:hypothetical protein ACOMHN_064965 [Nucella lapillus]